MKKSYSPNIYSKSIQNNYKKLKPTKNSNPNIQKNLLNNSNIQTYNKIIHTKNNYNTSRGQIKDSIPNIMTNQNNLNKIQIIKLKKNNFSKKLNTSGNRSARFLSSVDFHFQPILTDISNISKNKEKSDIPISAGINNLNNYYKNLYERTKNDNIKLLTTIKELEQKYFNSENIITKYQIKIQELEIVINRYKGINSRRESDKKKEYNLQNDERNKIIIENEKLKKEINKVLDDNNELKLKIKRKEESKIYIPIGEKNKKISNCNKLNNNSFHQLIKNKSFNLKSSACNKSFRLINNISIYNNNNNSPVKTISKKSKNKSNNINNESLPDNIINLKNINNSTKIIKELKNKNNLLMRQISESKNKDSYINDLEEEQKQNQITLKKNNKRK